MLADAVLLAGAMLLADAALVIVSAEAMEQRSAASSFRMKPIPSGEHTIPTKGAGHKGHGDEAWACEHHDLRRRT
jgi:hypothetical protein